MFYSLATLKDHSFQKYVNDAQSILKKTLKKCERLS